MIKIESNCFAENTKKSAKVKFFQSQSRLVRANKSNFMEWLEQVFMGWMPFQSPTSSAMKCEAILLLHRE